MLRRIASLFCVAILTAACSRVPTGMVGRDKASGITTLRVLAFSTDPLVDVAIKAYSAKYPNDRIEKVAFTPDPGQSLAQALQRTLALEEVDLVPAYDLPGLVKQNLVLPLDSYAQKARFDLKPFGPGLGLLRVGGKLYGLPYVNQPYVLVYNRAMFQAAGLATPQTGWTWEQFRESAQKLTHGAGESRVWGFSPSLTGDLAVQTLLLQEAGDPLNAHQDAAAMKAALSFFGTLVQSDRSMPPDPNRGSSGAKPTKLRSDFTSGKAGMGLDLLTNLQSTSQGSSLPFAFGVAPYPVVHSAGQPTAPANWSIFAMAASTRQPDAAWRFIQFLSGPEGAVAVAKAGYLPAYNTADAKNAWFDRRPAPPSGTEALFGTAWVPLTAGNSTDLLQAVSHAINQTLSGERSWNDALATYQAELAAAQKADGKKQ